MVSWIVIALFLLVIFVLVKSKHLKYRFVFAFLVLGLLFFYVTADNIISQNNIKIGSFGGISQFTQVYFNWLIHITGNVKSLTGNAVKMDWSTNTSTLINSSIK